MNSYTTASTTAGATAGALVRPAGPARARTHRTRPVDQPLRSRTHRPVTGTGQHHDHARPRTVGAATAVVMALLLVVGFDVVGSGATPAGADLRGPMPSPATVVARPGDTLWSIAGEHRGDVSIRRYVDALIDLNGGASIQAGQRVVLP